MDEPWVGFQLASRAPAVQIRHPQIHEDNVRAFCPGDSQSFGGVLRGEDAIPLFLESSRHQDAVVFDVVDVKHCRHNQRVDSMAGARAAKSVWRERKSWTVCSTSRSRASRVKSPF